MRCWLLMCSDLAMRSGTAAKIAPRHYDAARRTLTFSTKKGREMCLPVTDELNEILEPLANLDGDVPFVCHLHPWGHIGSNNLRTSMWRLRKRLGLSRRFTPHDLRRTTAARVYDQTHDLRVVQAVLGHRHLSSTFHYLDHRNTPVTPTVLEQARVKPKRETIQ
jgi:integrase